jgi:hypothetical protein
LKGDGRTKSALLAAGALLAVAGRAWGDYSPEWRDGCPAGDVELNPDVSYASADAAPLSRATEPRLVGPAPELDSALVPTRLLGALEVLHFGSGGADGPARIIGALVQLHLNFRIPETADAHPWVGGFTLTVPYLNTFSGDSAPDGSPSPAPGDVGNMVLALSGQHYWLTSILSGRSADVAGTVAGVRNALSGQLTFAFRPWTSDQNEPDEVFPLLQRTTFNSAYFAPHPSIGGAFEIRSEGVGCYAPFIHLRLSFAGNQDAAEQHFMLFFPETIAAGIAPTSNSTIMIQYGLLFSGYTGTAAQALLPSSVVHRLRFGLDYTSSSGWSAGGSFDLFLGNALYDGTALEAYLSWNFGFGPPLTPSKQHKDLYP